MCWSTGCRVVARIRHLDEFPYVIINENLDEALAELLAVFAAARVRLENQTQRAASLVASYLYRS